MILAVIPYTFVRRLAPVLPGAWSTGHSIRRRRLSRLRQQRLAITSPYRRGLQWALRIALVLLAMDLVYLGTIWPNWDKFRHAPTAKSAFIKTYEQQQRLDKSLPPLQWQPVRLREIPPHMQRVVIVAEDSRFYQHSGFDLIALKDAIGYNLSSLSFKYGASTISQQLVKNMFFSPSRNPLRKWHELIFTIGMELSVPKHRILATYLSVAEFGPGVYGVEAAALHYWGIHASELSLHQAIELAASLPSPRKNNPQTRTTPFLDRAEKIFGYLQY